MKYIEKKVTIYLAYSIDYVREIKNGYSTAGAQAPHLKFRNYEENFIIFCFINEKKNIFKFVTLASFYCHRFSLMFMLNVDN